ncbi:MAG: hypothetical protein O3A10_00805 [Chloroflexi bacterium]|nr:hypothetical protein [Chloroflexota bacterium]MDA1146321.1 hypothetical protein [Chloroflexota bacterium]
MPDPSLAERLDQLKEAVDAIKEAQEAAEGVEDIADQLDELTRRIDEARDDPDALDADTYADLALDLMLVIPNNLPLPDAAKKAIEAVASAIAAFIQGATGLALSLLARRFRDHLKAGMTPEEAARAATNTKAERSWLLTQFRLGKVTAAGDTREVKTPTEWLWEKFKGILSALTGGLLMDRSPLLVGAVLVFLVALVTFLLIGPFGLLGGGGGDVPADATEVPTAAPTESPAATAATSESPSPTPTAAPTEAIANQMPVIAGIQVTLRVPVTTYLVNVSDPDGDALSFNWGIAGENCGTPRSPLIQPGSSASFSWSHSTDAPDSCKHASTDHAVTVSVDVIEAGVPRWSCIIEGTETQTLTASACEPIR